jgi:iron-sulfur cluster repair protein YtfE (RIC family)
MEYRSHIARRLHDEHEAAFSLIARVRRAFTGVAADSAPDLAAPAWSALLRDFHAALEFEIAGHFDLEERVLFPLLAEAGEGDLVGILDDEHKAIRAIASPVIELLRKFRSARLDAADWRSLRALGWELCERLDSHARKEEVAMLPALDTLLDPEQDRELLASYADGR